MRVHAATWREGEHYVSRRVGAEVVARGRTAEETEANLVDALARSGVAQAGSAPPRLAVLETPRTAAAAVSPVEASSLVADLVPSGSEATATDRAEWLTRLKDVCAQYPHDDDATRLVREQRDVV